MMKFVNLILVIFERTIVNLIKLIYLSPILLFALFLLVHLYYPELIYKNKGVSSNKTDRSEDMLKRIKADKKPISRYHFHIVDEYIPTMAKSKPSCYSCHGTYAHYKDKKTGSVLNMHSGYIDCTVCHVKKQDMPDERFRIHWVDNASSETIKKPIGQFGKYSGKISLFHYENNWLEKYEPIDSILINKFLRSIDKSDDYKKGKRKDVLHQKISKKAVSCKECHNKDGYLNFTVLGYSENRINYLSSSELFGIFTNYEVFYLPALIKSDI
ncbi:MAG: hypothetical protein ABIA04_09330 [Pseudomonadota bacterium]